LPLGKFSDFNARGDESIHLIIDRLTCADGCVGLAFAWGGLLTVTCLGKSRQLFYITFLLHLLNIVARLQEPIDRLLQVCLKGFNH